MFGLVDAYAQGVSPPKNGGLVSDPNPVKLLVQPRETTMTGSFVAPANGRYQFVLQGAGGPGSSNGQGGPGCLAIRSVRLAKGQSVPYQVSRGTYGLLLPDDSTVGFSDRVMRAGAGQAPTDDETDPENPVHINGIGGGASGGDININGVQNSNQAASYGAFPGGFIGTIGGPGAFGAAPGGVPGGPGNSTSFGSPVGGPARLIVIFLGP